MGQFQAKMADNLADKEKRCLPNKKYLSGKNHLGTIGAGDGGLPRPRKQPTGLICVPLRCAALFDPSTPGDKTKPPSRDTAKGLSFMPVVGVEPITHDSTIKFTAA